MNVQQIHIAHEPSLPGPHTVRAAEEGRRQAAESSPVTAAADGVVVSAQVQELLRSLREIPDVRESAVADVQGRIAELASPGLSDRLAGAILTSLG